MPRWTAFPHPGAYRFDAGSVARDWQQLHAGDAEPLPGDPRVLRAWALLHNGEFQAAADAGVATGAAGLTVANKAACMYATYLEPAEAQRLQLFDAVAQRTHAQAAREPRNASAWYWHGYALARSSQGMSMAAALAQGLGGRVKEAFETAIKLQPLHADAHLALGTFHAEAIDKAGALAGGMSHGASRELGIGLFEAALQLNPRSAAAMIEYANGLLMLEGAQRMPEATRLYERAAACRPIDAVERLAVELARAQLLE